MALNRLKNWIAEVLTYSDLNAEFNNILSNPVALISPLTGDLDLDGKTITVDAAGATTFVSSASKSWDFTSGAKSGTPATTGSVANWAAQTFTDSNTAGSGTATNYVAFAIQRPTLAATNASVVTTNASTFYIPNAPAAGTNQTLTNSYALWTDDGRVRFDPSATVVSATSATLDAINITAQTATISGSTAITTATGVNFVAIGTPTYSAASALTITNAATLYVAAAPAGAGAGPATITNSYALWVDSGNVRFDGSMASNLIFVDGTFDIGASGATRPRDLFLSRNAVVGGTLNVTGVPTIPTASVDTNTTQAASTAFVLAQSATQAQQEAGTSIINFVSPGRQHFHPSAIQARAKWTSAGTPSVTAAYNVSGVVKNSTGNYTVSFTTAFSSANYCYSFGYEDTGGALSALVASQLAGSINVVFRNAAGTTADAPAMTVMCSGDL